MTTITTDLTSSGNQSINQSIRFDPPIEVLPGDEIRSRCVYDSRSSDHITYFGQGSYDEMCIIFFTYYPLNEHFDSCANFHDYTLCSLEDRLPEEEKRGFLGERPECDWTAFQTNSTIAALWGQIAMHCDEKGAMCYEACRPVVQKLLENPCMQGPNLVQVENTLRWSGQAALRQKLNSCEDYANVVVVIEENNDTEYPGDHHDDEDGGCPWKLEEVNSLAVGLRAAPVVLSLLLVLGYLH
jgi:hypothetical protein